MAVVLFDAAVRSSLYPLSYTKAVADIRFGIFTIRERWQHLFGVEIYIHTAGYLQCLYITPPNEVHTWINACVLPSDDVIEYINAMKPGDVLEDKNGIIACKGKGQTVDDVLANTANNFSLKPNVQWLFYPHQICGLNAEFIQSDFKLITKNRTSAPLSSDNNCVDQENIFIEEGAKVSFAIINAANGPVYIGRNATIMEGCLIKGPVSIGDNAVIKMGCKLYGASTIGPNCTAGGEIKNVMMQANSNKAHDGYLGDSVIGEWCNLGAGVSNSNLKNTADDIMLWNVFKNEYINAGNKCGVIMGDYTRVAINSSINTGSVYGASCNVFGEGLLPVQLRNFSWGVNGVGYSVDKAVKHIRQWKSFKNQQLSNEEESVLKYIFDNFMNE